MKKNQNRSKSVISFGSSISTAPTERIEWSNPLYFRSELKGTLVNRAHAPKLCSDAGRASSQRLKENNESIRVIEPQNFGNNVVKYSKKIYPKVCIDLTNCSGLLNLRQTNPTKRLGNFSKKVMVQGGHHYHYRNVTSKLNALCTSKNQNFSTGQRISNEIKLEKPTNRFLIPGKLTESQINISSRSQQPSPSRIKENANQQFQSNLEFGSMTPKTKELYIRQRNFADAKICRRSKFSDLKSVHKVRRVNISLSQQNSMSNSFNNIFNLSLEDQLQINKFGRKRNEGASRRILSSQSIVL